MSVKTCNFLTTFALLITCLPAGGKHLNAICNEGGRLTIMYWQHCPYIMSLPSGQVSGIFPHFLGSIVKQCCHGNVHLVYKQTKGPADFFAAIKRMRLTNDSVEEQRLKNASFSSLSLCHYITIPPQDCANSNTGSIKDDPNWNSRKNSLEPIELSSINKVRFPPVVTLDRWEIILSGPLRRAV